MVNFPTVQHKELFNERNLRNTHNENRPIKRRRKQSPEVIEISDESVKRDATDDSQDSDNFEDVTLDMEPEIDYEEANNSSGDSDDFEDVEFEVPNASYDFDEPKSKENELLSFQIQSKEEEQSPSKKKKAKFISNDERLRRVLIHKMYLVMLIIHAAIRNSWCNDKDIGKKLKNSCVTQQISKLLDDDESSDAIKSRRLLDGIKKLITIYESKYRLTAQGLIRKEWNELSVVQESAEIVTKKKFKRLVTNFRGSRDVAAQGFVALLRSLGLNARLVISLQPPDYTLITESEIKEGKKSTASFESSTYPIFWVEVWDKFGKKWISVDPIVSKSIEVCSKRKKSSFEPPSSDVRNQLVYVVAFDKYGRVRDVTRRYSYQYNAKTIRKRIEFKSNDDKEWYYRILNYCEKKKSKSVADIYEQKEFHERDLAEGMPNNIQAFKDHPLYALDSQLRQNEVIHPTDESSVCGMFRPRNSSSKLLKVYRRSSVYRLRSARAWYMKGRVLKLGASALKSKKSNNNSNEEEDVRLYAEFQTKLYVPPRIENGNIPKNQYGNIDVYTESMIPPNGSLIRTNDQVTMKLLIRCANLLEIDFAKAITSFDFTQRSKHTPNAKEGGIVILKDFEEALRLTIQHTLEEEKEHNRLMVELNALQNWRYILLKLRLNQRLNKTHGAVEDDTELNFLNNTEDGEEEIEDGGFVVDLPRNHEVEKFDDYEDDAIGGGFVVSDDELGELENGNENDIEESVLIEKTRKSRAATPKYQDDAFIGEGDDSESQMSKFISYSDSSGSEAEFKNDENEYEDEDEDEDDGLEFEFESD
ncbi:uncharacterized protein KGF55_004205 [Candida pseudojiufengensis]|uniref:uncharacterized protein n=1 Tax=Candida pseudojiufengensis TaxID=497109 RepID=UPI00222433B7|nr:uncharacterized protein KGF55_004205 [Candida pseudojiufengensis]KAI5960938.1 hypothetical protein KGF55_004205 [Candida pseudojiufengensis]